MGYDAEELRDPSRVLRCGRCDAVILVVLDPDEPWYDEYMVKFESHNKKANHVVS